MILVTYMPFYRIHEVLEYFQKNVEAIKPSSAIVYVDNVFHDRQKEMLRNIIPGNMDVRVGNWRSRSGTWFTMLRDLQGAGDVAIMDSDNVIDPMFSAVHPLMNYDMYTILDREAWGRGAPNTMMRSHKLGELNVNGTTITVFGYRIYEPNLMRKGTVLFIGPKQVVVYRKLPSLDVINKVEEAFLDVPPELRPFINDEGVLGILAYLSGIKVTPWIVLSNHMHHGSEHPASRTRKAIVASAQLKFAKSLQKRFKMKEFTLYRTKYFLSLIKDIWYLY
ncbi:hypothetical protein [Thermocladium modestius]|nr:hypothetical protein [Thermocladium modestius]